MALTKVVCCAIPFHITTDCEKLVPVIVNVKAGLPALIVAGESEVIVSGEGLMVKILVLEAPYVGSPTETVALPDAAIFAAGTCAVS